MPLSAPVAKASAVRSSSDWLRVRSSPATMSNSEAPIDEASADAEPPPGVGSDEANAEMTSRSDLEVSTLNCSR